MISTSIELGRPVSGDVIDLIVDDHRLFEQLLRQLRDATQDRDAVRHAFADVLIAHGEAEEELVYPVLRRKAADVGEHEVEHGYIRSQSRTKPQQAAKPARPSST